VHAALPTPALPGPIQVANAATALAAIGQLPGRLLPPGREAIEAGLRSVRLPGRFQRVPDARGFEWVFDVAHNPAAAATLAANLLALPVAGRTLAVCGMLGDKDVPAVVGTLRGAFDAWLAATPEGPRAIDDVELVHRRRCDAAGRTGGRRARAGGGDRATRRPDRRLRFLPHGRAGPRAPGRSPIIRARWMNHSRRG
jgi:dihydrofolate synthase / folylpolyglutamate synthase